MYTIINKTKNTAISHDGSWPSEYLEHRLNDGDKLIVISSYSDTIKVPYLNEIGEWDWENYNIPK